MERFGDYRENNLHLTFRNYATQAKEVRVDLDLAALGVPADEAGRLVACDLLLSFAPRSLPKQAWTVRVEADDSRAFWLGTPEGLARRALALADDGLRRVERLFRADLTEANRAALTDARKSVAAAAAETPADILARVERLQDLLDRLEPAVVTGAPIDRDKVFFRMKADLASSLVGLLGVRAEAPRAVQGTRGEATPVRLTLANSGGQALARLRFSARSPWREAAQASKVQDAATEVSPGGQEICTLSLFAPEQPQRELLPFLVECKGECAGKPFTLRVPVDLVLKMVRP